MLAISLIEMVRRALTLIGALLVAFHVWLFGSHVWQGQLVDLALAARWILAGGLIVALANLRRRGLSTVWSRPAVAVWLLAALLHGPAIARDLDVTAPAMPEVVATLSQTVIGFTALTGVLLVGLAGLRRRGTPSLRLLSLGTTSVSLRICAPRSFLHFAPRPPPLA